MEGKAMLTVQDVAKRLNMHYMTVYYWVRDGKLPAVQINKIYRIDERELEEFLKTKKVVAK